MVKTRVDPITVELIRQALEAIVYEMGVALIRSAYSTNIKERRDCSCALFDEAGHLIALAEHIPIHLGSMQGLMSEIAHNIKDWNIKPKDVIIANDPYHGGGSHLPDVTLIQPFFFKDELLGFIANIAHWADVGGRTPGVGTAGDSTEILQEGIRIPPTHIVKEGVMQEELLELLLLNMRNRSERFGDFRAQIASLLLGERRLKELYLHYDGEQIKESILDNYNYSERMLRNKITEIPEGNYKFLDYMDDDGIVQKPLKIRVKIKVKHGLKPTLTLDFSGTDPQTAGGINMVKAALFATVFYTVKAIIAPDIPFNAGFARPIHIFSPKKSLVNAREPSAVGGRTDTCQRVADVIIGALYQAIPQKVIAASNGATTAVIFGGTEALSGKDFVYIEAIGGGMGARSFKDGMDGVQVHITNTSNLPIEAMELEYPFQVMEYALVNDSGGPGTFRGGMAIRKEFKALKPILFSAHSDRHKIRPWGLNEGLPGACGKFILNPGRSNQKVLPSKISGVLINENDILRIITAGGGGYGTPLERDPEKVKKDNILEKVSKDQALNSYGVVIDETREIDQSATVRLRKKMRIIKED